MLKRKRSDNKPSFFNKRMTRLDKRIELAGQRKFMWLFFLVVAIIVAGGSGIIAAVAMVLKAVASVISGLIGLAAAIVKLVAVGITKLVEYFRNG